MKFNELDLNTKTARTRAGRGISAGRGKTAGRGTKGQNARSGGGVRPGFEGGQVPLMARLPKLKGFRPYKQPTETVFTGDLSRLTVSTVSNSTLAEAGLISTQYIPVKLVLRGDVDKKFSVQTQLISQNALAAIEKAGGTFKAVTTPQREASSKKK